MRCIGDANDVKPRGPLPGAPGDLQRRPVTGPWIGNRAVQAVDQPSSRSNSSGNMYCDIAYLTWFTGENECRGFVNGRRHRLGRFYLSSGTAQYMGSSCSGCRGVAPGPWRFETDTFGGFE